jgi:hypothetical protein
MQVLFGLGIAGRDHVALGGKPCENGLEMTSAHGHEADFPGPNARGRKHVDEIGIRIAVVALPDLGLFERAASSAERPRLAAS